MSAIQKWRWRFLCYESIAEGCPVQDWFNDLTRVEKEEIAYLLVYLQNMTDRPWRRPEFAVLGGENGISEIRFDLRLSLNGKAQKVDYRIYGFFPGRGVYVFLHGTKKELKNDTVGKGIARGRLAQLRLGTAATTHEFDYTGKPYPNAANWMGRPN